MTQHGNLTQTVYAKPSLLDQILDMPVADMPQAQAYQPSGLLDQVIDLGYARVVEPMEDLAAAAAAVTEAAEAAQKAATLQAMTELVEAYKLANAKLAAARPKVRILPPARRVNAVVEPPKTDRGRRVCACGVDGCNVGPFLVR